MSPKIRVWVGRYAGRHMPDDAATDAATDPAPIALGRPTYDHLEVEAVARCLESGWVAGWGPNGSALEMAFAARVGADHGVAVSSCTAGLHLALLGLGIGPGDEVLVADYTFPATGHSVLYTRAKPVFVDVTPTTFSIDVDRLAASVTPRTKAIIAVDQFGQCADWDELQAFATDAGLALIEDAACAAGAAYGDRHAGSFGDIAVFSLHGRKGISSGEGGIITTSNEQLADYARKASSFGIESARTRAGAEGLPIPTFETLGYNYKLSDIQAAVACVQLDKIDMFIERRNAVATAYSAGFSDLDGWATPTIGPGRNHTWQAYTLLAPTHADRDNLAVSLRAQGIGSNFGTYASHVQPIYASADAHCPVSADLFARHVALPMHAGLTADEISRVITAVHTIVD